ncbi:MAG: hypothetical protein WAW52_09335 [Methanothrix sp.]
MSLDIVTPDVIVSSHGKNAFGVAYDPESKKSFVASQGGCYADPLTGEITCIGANAEPSGAQRGQNLSKK